MAFDDDPIVDRNSEISETSITQTKKYFSRKNGFISRVIDGTDDYGVDIDCQLMSDGNALSFQFPIQVKSKNVFEEKILDEKKYKSLSFNTSRLGYLIRFKPFVGIIVIYDDLEKNCYYDFAYKVLNRIRIQKDSENWKKQDTVTIYIPLDNLLTTNRIKDLHAHLINFDKQHDKLFKEHAWKYDLPKIEGHNPVEIVIEYGELMLSLNKFFELKSILEKLERNTLKEPYVAYIAALTYAEIGDILEADYFFRIVKKHKANYTRDQRENLDFLEYKYKFNSGEYSRAELRDFLNGMDKQISSNIRKTYLEIAIFQEDVYDSVRKTEVNLHLLERFKILISKIEKRPKTDINRNLQILSSCEAITHYLGYLLTNELVNAQIRKDVGVNFVSDESKHILTETRNIYNLCHTYLVEIIQEAEKNNDNLLIAHSSYSFAVLYFGQFYSHFIGSSIWDNQEELITFFEELMNRGIKAYNGFQKLNSQPIAYKALHLISEIHQLAKYWINLDLNYILSLEKINKEKMKFDSTEFKKSNDSGVLKIYEEKQRLFKNTTKKSKNQKYRDLDDNKIDEICQAILQSKILPSERLPKVIKEMKDLRRFYTAIQDDNLILLSNQNGLGQDAYIDHSKYAVFTKNTDILICESSNIEWIINQLK